LIFNSFFIIYLQIANYLLQKEIDIIQIIPY